jgi:hypothetical protein
MSPNRNCSEITDNQLVEEEAESKFHVMSLGVAMSVINIDFKPQRNKIYIRFRFIEK